MSADHAMKTQLVRPNENSLYEIQCKSTAGTCLKTAEGLLSASGFVKNLSAGLILANASALHSSGWLDGIAIRQSAADLRG